MPEQQRSTEPMDPSDDDIPAEVWSKFAPSMLEYSELNYSSNSTYPVTIRAIDIVELLTGLVEVVETTVDRANRKRRPTLDDFVAVDLWPCIEDAKCLARSMRKRLYTQELDQALNRD